MECACLLSACGARGRAPDRALCRRTLRLAVGALALAVLASVAAEASVNYYSLLGVRRTADTATIKKAYKDMARKYHPDKYKGPSPVKMEDLNRAHEVLTDPDLRKKYDMYGKDPEDFDVQRAEDRRQRQQEFAQFGNMFGRRQHQNIESQTQTLTMHNYEVLRRRSCACASHPGPRAALPQLCAHWRRRCDSMHAPMRLAACARAARAINRAHALDTCFETGLTDIRVTVCVWRTRKRRAHAGNQELVNGLRQIWVIQVWRDNSCPHCHEIAPAWEEAAKELKGVVNFGRVNYERNGALLQFRLRQLPTIYCVTSSGEIRLMPSRHGYSAEEIVKFASGIVTSTSSVEKIDARGSAQRFLARPATSDKVHVILFDRGDWAAYHSAAMAPAWKDSMVFAVFSRPTLTDAFTRQFDVNPDERTVVVVREDGSSRKKTGMRSRKVLVRFLLQNQWPLVAKVTAQNWAQVCLGLGGATTGLHTLEHLVPSKRTDNRVCVLSMRNASSEKLRPELPVLRDAARSLADRDESVQFGWLVIERSDRLWQFLLAKNMVAQSQHETVASTSPPPRARNPPAMALALLPAFLTPCQCPVHQFIAASKRVEGIDEAFIDEGVHGA